MANNLTEFEKLRKQKLKKKFIKKFIYFLILCLVIYFVYLFYKNDYISSLVDNIGGIYKVLKKGEGYPVSLNAIDIKDKSKLGNEVLILDEDDIYILNKYGSKTLYQKHELTNPRVVSNNKKAVVYEHLGSKFQVYLKTKKVFEKKLDNIIYNMNLSDDGKLVIIKDSNQFVSSLEILNKNFKPIFKLNSADKYIIDVAFSKNNKDFAIASLGVDGSEYITTITFLSINKDQKISEIDLKNETVLSVKYKENGLYVIGTKSSYIINNKGEIIREYKYNNRIIKAYNDEYLKNIILIFENYNKLDNNDIIFLNNNLEEIGYQTIRGRIKDISGDQRRLYILTDENILEYNVTSRFIKKYNLSSSVSDIISVFDKLYKINLLEIDLIK